MRKKRERCWVRDEVKMRRVYLLRRARGMKPRVGKGVEVARHCPPTRLYKVQSITENCWLKRSSDMMVVDAVPI